MIYDGLKRKGKFYCTKGSIVFVSSCTRNASFVGEKSVNVIIFVVRHP